MIQSNTQRSTRRRQGAARKTLSSLLLIFAMFVNLLPVAPLVPAAFAAGGDFANTDFTASGPYSYDHTTGGGAYDNGSNSKTTGVVESLEGGDFACGDVVTYMAAIQISASPADANQTAEFDFLFLGDSTGQSGAAITDIIQVKVNRGVVSNGAGIGGTDAGLMDDGGSTATLISETVVDNTGAFGLFTPGAEVHGTVRVTDLEANEQVIVRVDVRLSCQPGTSPTGNLQGQLDAGRVVSPVTGTINTGQQTIPFLKIGDLLGAGEPVMRVYKTVTTATGTCPGSESLTVSAGDTVKYCYTVSNPGTAGLYNVTLVDDNGTPANTADDFTVTLSGLTAGDLPSGASATGSKLVTLASAGTVTNVAAATGDNNETGQKQVFYTDTDIATVTVNGPANRAPVANNDTATVAEGSNVTIPVADNDSDLDGNLVAGSVTVVESPAHGAVVVDEGTVVYTPDANYSGADSFTYQVCDSAGLCDTATVNVTITVANSAPQAVNDRYSTAEDTALTVPAATGVLVNDTDAEMGALTVTAFDAWSANGGTVAMNADGSFSYTPAANFNGTDTFTYTVSDSNGATATATVTITVGPVNDPPVATDDAATVSEDAPTTIDVLPNDSDPDGNPLTVSAVSDPANGSVVINPDGTVTYTPDANYSGGDSFTYTISDGNGDSSTATVNITVTPVNDAPVANDDTASTDEDVAVVIPVLNGDSDPDGDTLTVSAVGTAANGTVSLVDGVVTYTPNTNYNGTDTFSYTISDGNGGSSTAYVTVTIGALNDAPVAQDDNTSTDEDTAVTIDVITNSDSDVDGNLVVSSAVVLTDPTNGTVVSNGDGTFTYEPNENFNGTDSFTYKVCDSADPALCDSATVTIGVSSTNDAPLAVDDEASVAEDASVIIVASDLILNDTDVDAGDTLSFGDIVNGPANGTLTDNGDGTFTYEPNDNFNGSDSFTYEVCDSYNACAVATVVITVSPVNDAPVAVDNVGSTNEDAVLNVAAAGILGNDSDLDGDALSVSLVNGTAAVGQQIALDSGALLTVNADGSYSFDPNGQYNYLAAGKTATETFTYEASDGNGGAATATVIITITGVNEAPIAQPNYYVTAQNTALKIATSSLLSNDSDPNGDTLSVTTSVSATSAFGGTVSVSGTTVTYTPARDFAGYDTFTYTISDGKGGTATTTVTIEVTAKNGRSIAVSWGDWTRSGSALSGNFNIQNMSGPYKVQLQSFEILAQYRTSGQWTDVAVQGCSFNPTTPTLLDRTMNVQFQNCELMSAIPAGATVRVTAVVGIYGHKDKGQVKQFFLSRLSK